MNDDDFARLLHSRKVSRRSLIAGGAAAFLAACGGDVSVRPAGGKSRGPRVPDEIEDRLSIYNWADYVHPKTYPSFEEEFSVSITEDNYPSNEDALAKLQSGGGEGYDIIVPTGYMVEIMAREDLLFKLDHSKIPNLSSVEDRFLDLPFDPGNRYSVPKDYGTTGYGYRSKFVKEDMESWGDFFRLAPKYSGRYTVLDSPPEVVGAALKLLGYSYNSIEPKEISEATEEIIKLKPHVRRITSNMREILASGEAYVSLTWNGEVGYVALEASDVRYVIPAEGSEIWTDNWCVLATAPHPAAAHAFLNWHLQPKVQARDTEYHYYGSVVEAEEEFLDPSIAEDPSVYPPPEVAANLEIAEASPEWLALRNEAWTKFKAA